MTVTEYFPSFGRLKTYFIVARLWFTIHVTSQLPGGWHTAALVNTALMSVVSILMIIFSAVALIEANGFNKPLVFFTGGCGTRGAVTLNAVLHLLINIFSTAMLASSNMFMQILSAPSRHEVDKAHAKGSWLEIGVLSGRNVLRQSRFKMLSWLGFLLTSIPVHLLFNSSVVQISYRSANYDLAIAAEPFIWNGTYQSPGASLLASGGSRVRGYGGAYIDLMQYQHETSEINQKIASTSRQGGTWTRIKKDACKQQYVDCNGLSSFANVIFVVTDTPGWSTSRVWNLTQEQASFYNHFMPDGTERSEYNSLWFYGQCTMYAVSEMGRIACQNTCNRAQNHTEDFVITFYPDLSTANAAIQRGMNKSSVNMTSVYNWDYNNLNIDYCLAQPAKQSCKVALSTTLLACVTVCAISKAILCAWVYYRLRKEKLLVTLGDAIDSFVSNSDRYTAGMCIVSQGELRMAAFCVAPQPGPRKYRQRNRTLGVNVTSTTLAAFIFMVACTSGFSIILGIILAVRHGGLSGGFGTDMSNPLTFPGASLISAALVVNSPQLALSIFYVTYNNLCTRLLVGKGWAMRSVRYSSLRVTSPKGLQRSTYRLQLPYRCSIPLIVGSAVFHWLLSNTIYVFISQGDYLTPPTLIAEPTTPVYVNSGIPYYIEPGLTYSDSSLPPDSLVSVGYSIVTLMLLTIIAVAAVAALLVWSRKRLPGCATSVGCNSFAISASCHVSSLSKPDPELDTSTSSTLHECDSSLGAWKLVANRLLTRIKMRDNEMLSNDSEEERRGRVAQSKLKWGVVKMPDEWYHVYDESYGKVGHVTFGTTEDEVESPQDGHFYA